MTSDLNLEEKACGYDTMQHIERVRNILGEFVVEILDHIAHHADETPLMLTKDDYELIFGGAES